MKNHLKRIKIRYVLLLAVLAAVLFFALPTRLAGAPAEIEYLRADRFDGTSWEHIDLTEEQETALRELLSQTAFRRTLSGCNALTSSDLELSFHCRRKPFHLPIRRDAGLCYSSSDDLIQYSAVNPEALMARLEEILK